MSNDITYMDCWHFIAPLIPVNTDYTMDIYVMVFGALKEAERRASKKRKRFIKLLMGRLMLTRNEATYVANVVRAADKTEKRRRK